MFSNTDETGWWDEFAIFIYHAQQCLISNYVKLVEILNRLEVQHKAILSKGNLNAIFPVQQRLNLHFLIDIIDANAITPFFLCLIHGNIGTGKEFFRHGAMQRKQHYTYTRSKAAVINKGIKSMCRIGSNDVIPIAMK